MPSLRRFFWQALVAALLLFLAGCSSNGGGEPDAAVTPDAAPPPGPLSLVEACVRLSACDVARRPRLVDCLDNYFNREIVYGWRRLVDRAYRCANEGGSSCKVIRECFGFSGKPTICDKSFQPRCDGEVAVTCDLSRRDGWEQHIDCSKGGLKCALMTTGLNQVTAACGGGPCEQAHDKPRCQDRRKLTCRGSGWEISDCPELGLQCRDPAVEQCEGTGRSCPEGNAICDGNIWKSCVQGYLHEVDCGKLPGRKICDQQQRKCVGSGKECVAGDFLDLCEGDTLVTCVDGFKRRFDCKKMGFLSCVPMQPFGAYCRGEEVYE